MQEYVHDILYGITTLLECNSKTGSLDTKARYIKIDITLLHCNTILTRFNEIVF